MEPFDRQRIASALASAAIDPSRWTEALETAAAYTGSYGALLLPVVGALPIVAASASMEESMAVYVSGGWNTRDERYRAWGPFFEIGVATDDDCLPLDARKRSPFYQEFLGACNLRDWAGVRVGRGELVWNLSLQRTPDQGPFSPNELQWLAQLSGTLDSIVQISAALGLAKGDAALGAFDFSERAALLLDRLGRVVRVNAAAERLIGEDLQISAGRLRCRNPKSNVVLDRAIKTMLWSLEASNVAPVNLPKSSGGRLIAYPMPIPGLTESPLSAFHTILVITDTDDNHSAAITTLRNIFDLTAAESRLAVAIATGKNLETFAVERQLSKQTVRNQLKSIFLKTDTNRQTQLAVMLSTLLPNK